MCRILRGDGGTCARGRFRIRLDGGGFVRLSVGGLFQLGGKGLVWLSGKGLFRLALSDWVVRGVPAMGGFSEGGGVRVNCLFGVKTGAGVILSLLTGFFPFLLLVKAEGAMIALLGRRVVVFAGRGENFSLRAVGT